MYVKLLTLGWQIKMIALFFPNHIPLPYSYGEILLSLVFIDSSYTEDNSIFLECTTSIHRNHATSGEHTTTQRHAAKRTRLSHSPLLLELRFWLLGPPPANMDNKNQASDHSFRICDSTVHIELELIIESFDFSLLIFTIRFSWKTQDKLNMTCFRLLIPLLITQAIPSNMHIHEIL